MPSLTITEIASVANLAAETCQKESKNATNENLVVKNNSILERVAAILSAFSAEKPVLHIEEAGMLLGASDATVYRYLGDLCKIGLLAKRQGGYVLGPKVFELEFILARTDPVLSREVETFNNLARVTGCHVLFCNIYGNHLVNVFHAPSETPLNITFTKGLPMPLFRGSQARVALAQMERRRLRQLYDAHGDDADARRLGTDWKTFFEKMKTIREAGYAISRDELDQGVTGIAAPVFECGTFLGSLVFAYSSESPPPMEEHELIEVLVSEAENITNRLSASCQIGSKGA